MACCSPSFDDEDPLVEQDEYKACFHDLAETACISLWTQLKDLKEKLTYTDDNSDTWTLEVGPLFFTP